MAGGGFQRNEFSEAKPRPAGQENFFEAGTPCMLFPPNIK